MKDKIINFIGYCFISFYVISIITLFVFIFMGYGDVVPYDLLNEFFGQTTAS